MVFEEVNTMSVMEPLIRLLAERHSQSEIARILNNKKLWREDGKPWHQGAVSLFMAKHQIEPAFIFNRFNSSSSTNNKNGVPYVQPQERQHL